MARQREPDFIILAVMAAPSVVRALCYMSSAPCPQHNLLLSLTVILFSFETAVKDTSAMPCPPGETCHRVDGWVRAVYDTIAECCQSGDPLLPDTVSPEYCEARSTGAGTEKWFKNEGHAWCSKHCSNATNATDSACESPSTPPSFYYDTAQECCTVQLDYLNPMTCVELSEKGGVLSDLVGTEEYYVDWVKLRCVNILC